MTIVYTDTGYGSTSYGGAPYGTGGRQGASGFEVDVIKASSYGFEVEVAFYNTNNLRILCDFLSRGASVASATLNAWGNPIGNGLSWKASTTEPSSTDGFDVKNLNTDIEEQYWRGATGVKTGINLDCDTEISQGVFLDTFAIRGTNLSSSADISLYGSDDSTFSTVGVSIPLEVVNGDGVIYIAPVLPAEGYQFWRISINDSANPEDFIRIGTVVFGEATIFQGECFVDRVTLDPIQFVDVLKTEGHTNVMNDRGMKQKLGLQFKSIDFNGSNFPKIKRVFNHSSTILKCLWIPTPEYPHRFATFGKLTKIPRETHNDKGELASYVDFNIEVDESR